MSGNFEADIINLQNEINKARGQSDIEQGANYHQEFYPEPVRPEDIEEKTPVNLVDHSRNDVLTQFSISISRTVQFPESTVFLHAIGCIAAAMNRSFTVDYFGEMPVCLYVVTAQPPSTGKSGVNNYLSIPIREAYKELNDKNMRTIKKAKSEIKRLLKLLKSASSEQEEDDINNDIFAQHEIIEQNPIYKPIVTNATPEGLEMCAFQQQGIFNIISDEAGSINSVLGLTYGERGRPSNSDLVLQAWDGNYFSSLRVGRGANHGKVRGSISVIAQSETVNAILSQGDRGNGLSERFLLCAEQNILGTRNQLTHTNINIDIKNKYAKLIRNLVLSDNVELKLTDESKQFLKDKMHDLEPYLGDCGKYSSNMLRGFVGKMAKQVIKISAVLHAVKHYQDGISTVHIDKPTVKWAYDIFSEITKLYIEAADNQGFVGERSQLKSCYKYLLSSAEKGVYKVRVQRMIDAIKKQTCWKHQSKQITHFRANIMPKLSSMNICQYDKDANYLVINPKL